jgi:hypothetical protein
MSVSIAVAIALVVATVAARRQVLFVSEWSTANE